METTSLIALSRQGGLRRQMDIVANNIANMNTNGFKGERVMFVEHLVKSPGGQKLLGGKLSFVRDISTMLDFSEGPVERTGNPSTWPLTAMDISLFRPKTVNDTPATAALSWMTAGNW